MYITHLEHTEHTPVLELGQYTSILQQCKYPTFKSTSLRKNNCFLSFIHKDKFIKTAEFYIGHYVKDMD
jgi:hypothetical protein